ncbi:MAG: hypothetical protein OJF59_002079 [Cytophagales bacterium]|jgi:hypothetical protein|nr:hypothetical protein [Bacteroidota bacterium]MBS1980967.1 hypothetical protein [Bacteroidota bacterium]WHZ08326.1 MAG: hypothetical protein OJF59_002079 [Cytophagales bacterium]
MHYLLKYKLTLLGIIIGGIAGYTYYHFVGCTRGTCPITSRPLNSTAYGALIGALLFPSFKKETTKNITSENEKK